MESGGTAQNHHRFRTSPRDPFSPFSPSGSSTAPLSQHLTSPGPFTDLTRGQPSMFHGFQKPEAPHRANLTPRREGKRRVSLGLLAMV